MRESIDREAVAQAVAALAAAAVRANGPRLAVWVNYSGHVDHLEVRAMPGGYRAGNPVVAVLGGYGPGAADGRLASPTILRDIAGAMGRLAALAAGPPTGAAPRPTRRRGRTWSPEARRAAAERMRAMWASGAMGRRPTRPAPAEAEARAADGEG